MQSCAVLILAAGLGTRMKSSLPKVLHEVAGRPLLGHVLETARGLSPERIVAVVGHGAELVKERLGGSDVAWAIQKEQKGTAHAVQCALPALEGFEGPLLILCGDVPLLKRETLEKLLDQHRREENAVTVLSMALPEPYGYGRMVRGKKGNVLKRIVEEKDASKAQREIHEVNSGTYCVDAGSLAGWLGKLGNDNAQGEFYLTDIVELANKEGAGEAAACLHEGSEPMELAGINNRLQLAEMEAAFRDRQVVRWMVEGVSFIDPTSCFIAADALIGRDTVIQPNVMIGPGVEIGEGVRIGPFTQIKDSRLGDGVEVHAFCHLEGVDLAGPNVIGPYARLRPGTVLEENAKVGNFCETKKALVRAGAKINHLSYVGDAEVGEKANVGAGTITCNYDGVNKHKTVIGAGAFIGSNASLVAPVTIGAKGTVAAGTALSKDVPEGALGISRAPQRTLNGWADRPKPGKK